MRIQRSFALIVLIASFYGAAHAQLPASLPAALDDEVIFIAVEEALHDARLLARADITVRSQDGFITLSGVAESLEDIAAAGRIATRVRGVTGVKNKLRLADRPSHA